MPELSKAIDGAEWQQGATASSAATKRGHKPNHYRGPERQVQPRILELCQTLSRAYCAAVCLLTRYSKLVGGLELDSLEHQYLENG